MQDAGGNSMRITTGKEIDFAAGYSEIKITPEIMLKCGFKKGAENFYMFGGLEINIDDMDDVIMDGFGHIEVTWLHQLQNLYFALTNNELNVRL